MHEPEPDSEADCPGVTDPVTPKTGDESPTLKGVFWPGMDLFDAATEEMRKRRNQKKDGIALKNMEKTSELVKPAEAIYSPRGTWQKTRVITGNVEDTSPLRGETPIPKPVRKRRQPLAETDGNIPRRFNRVVHDKKRKVRGQRLKERPKETTPYIVSPSNAGSYRPSSRFSPTEDENTEFMLTVSNLRPRKKRGNFAIFNDSEHGGQSRSHSTTAGSESSRLRPQFAQTYAQQGTDRPQMQLMTTPWLQPQHQQSTSYDSIYTSVGQSGHQSTSCDGFGTGKENIESELATAGGYSKTSGNAQGVVTAQDHFRSLQAPRLGGNFGLGGFSMFDDPFGYNTNPLSAAFQQIPAAFGTSFLPGRNSYSADFVAENPRGIISPDGTVSDADGLDNARSLFATSE